MLRIKSVIENPTNLSAGRRVLRDVSVPRGLSRIIILRSCQFRSVRYYSIRAHVRKPESKAIRECYFVRQRTNFILGTLSKDAALSLRDVVLHCPMPIQFMFYRAEVRVLTNTGFEEFNLACFPVREAFNLVSPVVNVRRGHLYDCLRWDSPSHFAVLINTREQLTQ